ncbi:DUF2958 domain-containing protein [Microvirga lotononidis]|uniref:DUF2958 domain-containing protein n=1 Tax=Microvirga lotononidis TaxID=864069 RepID=I4Z229_9HYPH|nr:DUF2958 domain-containing protein [Microvirga lotononidis]EIM30271.1 Protein of unknown function (DUF2958) [Microvirga lotononidis]WQO31114.1 DUF2958 domain-containing protein [Microvirga lotononidis]WQO31132.1 DUF2958 domain-containing protein [Microvirga lotononidis]
METLTAPHPTIAHLFDADEWSQLLMNGRIANRVHTDPVPVVKPFTPHADWVWLVAEIHPEDGDTAMGLIDNGQGFPVKGYFRLSDITDPSKPPVYKDLNFHLRPKRPLSEHYADAVKAGAITI